MNSILKKIQPTVIKYSEVLSKILRVDVEIVDRDMVRIAGTGDYKNKINKDIGREGYIYTKVMDEGESKIVTEPGKHPVCENCYKRDNCDETFEVSMPIKIEDEVIGVIGLVCFTDEQRDHMLDNLDVFKDFLGQIAELISLKAKETLELDKVLDLIDLLTNVINEVEQGVLVLDEDNNVLSINDKAISILGLDYTPNKITFLQKTKNKILGYMEYEVDIGGRDHMILGDEYHISEGNPDGERILIFTDLDSIKKVSSSISSTKEYVDLDYIRGESREISNLKNKIFKIAESSSTIMITGESGTGKELFARAIHTESGRRDKPFVALNCAAIPDTLLESELFGYVKGAFPGADANGKIGKIEFADGGTLFLDEIAEMPIYLQSKLLQVLEDRAIERLGSNISTPVDIRVIAATNQDLEELIGENRFREDLYYRLNVIPLEIGPLRKRKADIESLARYFKGKYSRLFNKGEIEISDEVWDYLYDYDWPGNVRELENAMEYALNMVDYNGVLKEIHLPRSIVRGEILDVSSLSLEDMEKKYIKKALKIYGEDSDGKIEAAEELGIGIATLYRKINKYGI